MIKEFVSYNQALALKELGFDEPCLANLIGFGDGSKENGRYKINQQQVFYPNDYTSSDDKAEELGLHPFGMCGVPLYQQVFRWFREKHGMLGCIEFVEPEYGGDYGYKLYYKPGHLYIDHWNKGFKTYEEAEQACLDKLIEICKTK